MTQAAPSPCEQTCSNCRHWSQWLTDLGDCMSYAEKRQLAFIASDDAEAFARDWPERPARESEPNEACGDWEAQA